MLQQSFVQTRHTSGSLLPIGNASVPQGRLLARHHHWSGSAGFVHPRPSVQMNSALVDREDAAAAVKPTSPSLGYEKSVLLQGAQGLECAMFVHGYHTPMAVRKRPWSRRKTPHGLLFSEVSIAFS
jgi:hypothetical protein